MARARKPDFSVGGNIVTEVSALIIAFAIIGFAVAYFTNLPPSDVEPLVYLEGPSFAVPEGDVETPLEELETSPVYLPPQDGVYDT